MLPNLMGFTAYELQIVILVILLTLFYRDTGFI